LGTLISFSGVALIGWSDFRFEGEAAGSVYSVLTALFVAVYFVAGRRVRQNTPLGAYTVLVNTVCALFLTAAALFSKEAFKPLRAPNVLTFFGLAVFGALLGHIGINWGLRYVTADVVGLATLSLPLFSALYAYLFFGETVSEETLIGSLLVLAGIALYVLIHNGHRKKTAEAALERETGG